MDDCRRHPALISRRSALAAGAGLLWARSRAPARDDAGRSTSLAITDRLSPKNARRPVRPATRFIVLHTTEGEENGSLGKIQRRGEAHFVVAASGKVYRVIDRRRIATHAGRSMWEGLRVIDNYSIGIEVVGYHDQDVTAAQYESLREMLRQLKAAYGIADENVVTHSMVAYGRPNRFHHAEHRGRKRCGMVFARPDVRARLGLKAGPRHDADVESGRLKVADPELYAFLFPRPSARAPRAAIADAAQVAAPPQVVPAFPSESRIITHERTAWQVAREQYDHAETVYTFPNGEEKRGDEIEDWNAIPAGTRVTLGEVDPNQEFEGFQEVPKDGTTAREIAGDAWLARTTIYFLPDGLIRTGYELNRRRSGRARLRRLPTGTRLLVGYVYGGHVKSRRPPRAIAGYKWNFPSTFYRLPDGVVMSGDEIDPAAVPAGTLVFFQN